MSLGFFLMGSLYGVAIAHILFSDYQIKEEDEVRYISIREYIEDLAELVVRREFGGTTTMKGLTNIFFEVDETEYRAVLTVEEREAWEERKERKKEEREDNNYSFKVTSL